MVYITCFFFLYWVCVYLIALIMESHASGFEKYLLRIIAEGFDLFTFFEIVVMILVGFIDKKWFKYNKAMLTLTVLYSGAYLLLNLIIIYLPVCFLLFVL